MMAQFLSSMPNEVHLLQINNSLLAENTARMQNEWQLYSAWQQSEMDKKLMETTIQNLNEQLTNSVELSTAWEATSYAAIR
jgi:hypothetical protein